MQLEHVIYEVTDAIAVATGGSLVRQKRSAACGLLKACLSPALRIHFQGTQLAIGREAVMLLQADVGYHWEAYRATSAMALPGI